MARRCGPNRTCSYPKAAWFRQAMGYYSGGSEPEPEFEALDGNTTFPMNDIPGENLSPELYIAYKVPAAANCPLLVYVHGWDGEAGVDGAFHADAITMLLNTGIGILAVGMRGRNTGVGGANDSEDVEEYRDASALECYDIYASIKYFLDEIVPAGQVNRNKLIGYGVSGGAGNLFGVGAKFPDLFAMLVLFYGMPKYGTYTGDPNSDVTSWYADNAGFQGAIQLAVAGVPLGSGVIDAAYLSRDHTRGIKNFTGKIFMYHDSGDGTVSKDGSDLAVENLIAAGKEEGVDYEYFESSNGLYAHGHHALDVTYYDGSFGMQWLSDALALTKQSLPNSGTVHVCGYAIASTDLERDFEFWIKRYRKNNTATPRAGALTTNQGKTFAATLTYNKTNETFEVTPIIPSTSDQFFFAEIIKGSKRVSALLQAADTVTLQPKVLQKYPANLSAYDWKVYYNFGDSADGYLLDDAGKVSNVFDLTGNNNFAFQQTRATRASIVSGSLDNGVMYLAGASGTLSTNVDFLQFSGAFTIVFCLDPDAANVGTLSGGVLGRGAGSQSQFTFGTFSGKVQITVGDQAGGSVSNATPSNSDVGKQAWYVRRDASNNIFAKCRNGTNTYDYGNIGTLSGAFQFRVFGSSASFSKSFSGKIYRIAAAAEDIGNTDATAVINDWYAN